MDGVCQGHNEVIMRQRETFPLTPASGVADTRLVFRPTKATAGERGGRTPDRCAAAKSKIPSSLMGIGAQVHDAVPALDVIQNVHDAH